MLRFEIDPRILSASAEVLDLPLCAVRLQNDARYPWLVLLPRRAGMVELGDLCAQERAQALEEAVAATVAVRAVGHALGRPVARTNLGALGLIVPQLHLHVVGRRPGDAAWPGPVWGHGAPELYKSVDLARAVEVARAALMTQGPETVPV